MSSPENQNIQPDAQTLDRSSHLRILTENSNTVRHLREGRDGKLIPWTTSNGEHREAKFQYEEPELEPVVLNGEIVEWINPTDQKCTIVFDKDECKESPFEQGEREFTIAPGHSVFSGVIKGKHGARYRYLVKFDQRPGNDDGSVLGNPVIIVR